MSEEQAAWLLPLFVGTFVPMEIMRLEQLGGPSAEEMAAAAEAWINFVEMEMPAAKVVNPSEPKSPAPRTEGGAELYYRVKGKTAKAASLLVGTIAVMAFAPGGIEIFGHHFVAYEMPTGEKDERVDQP